MIRLYLTREEERVYDGERGWARQMCMRIIAKLGDLFGADKLIPVESAHVSGVSYKTIGDNASDFLKSLADAGGKIKVGATLNPQGSDSEYLEKHLPKQLVEKQSNILKQFERMGFALSLTCTPYYLKKPSKCAHLAWAESSAIVYANSILGAWTNREGGPSALASAIVGKTPDYGVHRAENRIPKVLVNVNAKLENESAFGALGIYLGKLLKAKIPLIQGLGKPSETDLKQLSAALAASGMVNMFHRDQDNLPTKMKDAEKVTVEAKDIHRTAEELSTASTKKPDLVFIGCPHCSLNEIRRIAHFMKGKKVKTGLEFWVCTSPYVKEKARNYVKQIGHSGGHVLAGVCTIVSWTEKLGIKTIMTNSAKTAFYAPTMNKAETILAPTSDCLKMALQG